MAVRKRVIRAVQLVRRRIETVVRAPVSSGHVFTSGAFSSDQVRVGVIAVDLAASFPFWVRRRKTQTTFVDETTVIQRQSVDLILPPREWFGTTPPRRGETIFVPLGIFDKETLPGFSVTDADAKAVSVLSTHENGGLATEGLSAVIDGYTAPDPSIPTGAFHEVIEAVVRAPNRATASEAFQRAIDDGLPSVLSEAEEHLALLDDLRGGFLMLVPVRYRPDANHLFKIEWASPYRWRQKGAGGAVRSVAASLGLLSKRLDFTDLPIGWAQGTHFEFVQPDEVRLLKTSMDVKQADPELGLVEEQRYRVTHYRPRAIVNASVRDPTNPVLSRGDVASVELSLRPRRGGPFFAIWVVSLLTAALLWIVSSRLAEIDAQSTAAVVLALPAILAAYLAREGEHAIAGRLRAGIRVCGLVIAGIAFAASVTIAVGDLREGASPRSVLRCEQAPAPKSQAPPRSTSRRSSIVCSMHEFTPEQGPKRSTHVFLQILAGIASFLAGFISAGLLLTHVTTVRAARMRDREQAVPIP